MDSEDDDFGDFGGFEAAEPVNGENAIPPAAATSTPWAVMAAAAPSQASVLPQQDLETSGAAGSEFDPQGPDSVSQSKSEKQEKPSENGSESSAEACPPEQKPLPNIDDPGSATNWADIGEDFDLKLTDNDAAPFKADFSQLGQQSSVSEAAVASLAWSNQDNLPTDLNPADTTSRKSEPTSSTGKLMKSTDDKSPSSSITNLDIDLDLDLELDLPKLNHSGIKSDTISAESLESLQVSETISEMKKTPDLALGDEVSTGKESSAEQEKMHTILQDQLQSLKEQHNTMAQDLQKELQVLMKRNTTLEDGIKQLQEELESQKSKHELIQKKHEFELEEMRESGHKALAIIIEEYKELSRVAVLQQQEESQQQLKDALNDQLELQKSVLESLEKTCSTRMESLQNEMQKRMEQQLEDQQEKNQVQLKIALDAEAEKCQEMVQKVLKEEQLSHRKKLEEAVQEERERSQHLLGDERKKLQEEIAGLKLDSMTSISKAMEDERNRCKACVAEAVATERQQQESVMKEVLSSAREQMREYINEHRQADNRVTQRSLTSIDLFLDSARQQIQHLMQPSSTQTKPDS